MRYPPFIREVARARSCFSQPRARFRAASRVTGAALAVLMTASMLALGQPAASDAPAAPAPTLTRIEYEGTLFNEAHYRRPGENHSFHTHQVFTTDGRGVVRLDWTNWRDQDSVRVPETYLLVGDRTLHRDAPDRPWTEYLGPRERKERLPALAGFPAVLDREARSERDPFVELRETGGRLQRYTRLKPHPRLGDVRDSVAFTYTRDEIVPATLAMALYSRDSNWRFTERRTGWSSAPQPDSLFAQPASARPDTSYEDDSLSAVPSLTPVAAGIWSIDMKDIDSRTLVVEFADRLAVIETAVGSANGERIVDAIRRQWPSKPISYALFSHYHPHYTGGLRALIAEGATVITTPGNEGFVRGVARYPFRTWPDRLARRPQPLRVVTFKERYELADTLNRLVAIDYGARSDHTDEFVVFWFPVQKLMFEAEQGWSTSNGKLRAGRRAKALLGWIDQQGLDVERIVQSWPMRDTDGIVTRAKLDSLVSALR